MISPNIDRALYRESWRYRIKIWWTMGAPLRPKHHDEFLAAVVKESARKTYHLLQDERCP